MNDFILQHRLDDPHDLALRQSRYPDVDIPYAVQQISAWQTARRKLPLWASIDGIIYPPHLNMEQCSSQLTAEYKASIVDGGESMTDLTGGFGVDAAILSQKFGHLNYVERNGELCDIARHNLPLLGILDFTIFNDDATTVLTALPHQSLIFIDPARRDENGCKTVLISDCTPDVSALQQALVGKADMVMVKLSPMLNLTDIADQLHDVCQIHIVSVDNECKEILALLSSRTGQPLRITCVNLKSNGCQDTYSFLPDMERQAECHYTDQVLSYLYEPNTSVMKSACFRSLAQAYNLLKLHPSSHLYTSDHLVSDFPGRIFRTVSVCNPKDKSLKSLKKANLTVRNFPSTVAELRKRLKLTDGGSDYLFATTLADERKVIVWTEKC